MRLPGDPAAKQRLADISLALTTVVWGATFVMVKSALVHVSPLLFLALRFWVAAVALAILFRQSGRTIRNRPRLGAGVLTGFFLFAGYILQTLGLRLTTAPKSAFLTGLCSVMVPLLGSIVYKTKPRASEVIGLLVATLGLALMTLEGPIGSISRGDALTLLCAVAFAAHVVSVGHYSELIGFALLSISQVTAAALFASLLFWWAEKPFVAWNLPVISAVLVTGLFCTAFAFTTQAWALQYTSATRAALIFLLEPIFAWLTSYVLVREGLSARAAIGAALILGGVLVVELKPLNPRPHPSH